MENKHYRVRDNHLVPLNGEAFETLAKYLEDHAKYMAAGDGSYHFEDDPFTLVDAFDACSSYMGEPRRRERGDLVPPSLAEDVEHLRAARGVFEDRRCGDPDDITIAIDALQGECCDECGADLQDGEGYAGRCGTCADRAEARG